MNNVIRWKDNVLPLAHLAPAGIRLLGALERGARHVIQHDLTITCADKEHNASDPHSSGEAFDVRTHDLTDTQKHALLDAVMKDLSDSVVTDPIIPKDGGFVTKAFFGWIEHPGEANEHIHVQRRNHTVYP